MKKKLSYILLLTLTGIFFSCVDEGTRTNDSTDPGDGVKLTISLTMPQMQTIQTRGVLDDETLNPDQITDSYLEGLKLYMFIFENTGSPESNYLLTLIHGDRINVTSTDYENGGSRHPGQVLQTYTATMEGTSEDAIIHLVATADPLFEEQLQEATDRTELGLFYGSNGLYTSGRYPAFWKRIDLEKPITKENVETDEFKEKLSHVQMIRNFCRVAVSLNPESEELNGFTLDGYAIVNQVDKGYVAAYSDNDPRGFVEFEASDASGKLSGTMKPYAEVLTKDNYAPARHPLSVREHKEEDGAWLPAAGQTDNIFTDKAKYMFERPYQTEHHTFVVIKGHFADKPAEYKYIKLDIGDIPEWYFDETQGFLSTAFEYRHLYRNFAYNIIINKVATKDVGSATPEGAIYGPATNNVGATVETQSITDISDGLDRMWVNQTKFIIVDDDRGNASPASYDLMWRYVVNWNPAPGTNVSENIRFNYPGMALGPDDDSGIFQTVTPITKGDRWPEGWDNDNFGGWAGARITFNKPDETVRQKTVRLYYSDPSNNKPNVRLSRDVTFVMRKRWAFVNNSPEIYPSNVEVYPGAYSFENYTMPYETLDEMRENITPGYVGSQRGAQLTVMFELPADLPQAIFPLDFKIGFDRQNVENAYAGNAVVTTGPSMFEDTPGEIGVPRMQFIKTVTWEYYHGDDTKPGHRIVTSRFITTNDVIDESGFNDVAAKTRVRVSNQYFTMGADDFERAAHDDVIDPTRTNWYWNFSYPEWGTYFTMYNDCANDPANWPKESEDENDANPHDLNNLNFAGYSHGTAISRTYLRVTSDADGVTRSESNPEIWFPLEYKAETGCTAVLSLEVSTGKQAYRDRDNVFSAWRYYFYNRKVHAVVVTDKKSYRYDSPAWAVESKYNEYKIATLAPSFTIDPGETITQVKIWSEKEAIHTDNNNYDLDGQTNYYSIRFSISSN